MADVSYNCSCDDGGIATKTLAELRTRMLLRLGYSAQLASPPAGLLAKIDTFLQDAQEYLFLTYDEFRQVRFFNWPLVADTAHYDIADNADTCTKPWSPEKVEGAWIVQADSSVWPLRYGVDPTMYGSPQPPGWPSRYEIRQCIELWPTPGPEADDLTLIVKGQFGLGRFTEPTDTTSIDWLCVFYHALALAKADKGQPDAGNYPQLLMSRLGEITAAGHVNSRYIPGSRRRYDDLLTATYDPEDSSNIRIVGETSVRVVNP